MALSRRILLASVAALAAVPAAQAATALFSDYTKAKFDAALKGNQPVLVHVHASWCPVCTRQQAVIGKIAGNGSLKNWTALKVDFDSEEEFKRAYGVQQQSVLILFKGGKEIARAGGITSESAIADFLKKAG